MVELVLSAVLEDGTHKAYRQVPPSDLVRSSHISTETTHSRYLEEPSSSASPNLGSSQNTFDQDVLHARSLEGIRQQSISPKARFLRSHPTPPQALPKSATPFNTMAWQMLTTRDLSSKPNLCNEEPSVAGAEMESMRQVRSLPCKSSLLHPELESMF